MRDGVAGLEMAEEMEELAGELLPLASPMMDHVHQRFLRHFVEQDVIGHMEADARRGERRPRPPARRDRLRRPRRLHAPDRGGRATRRRSTRSSASSRPSSMTLPDDARIVKTIGDEVMVVGTDAAGAAPTGPSASRSSTTERPLPRIGIHAGERALPRRRLLRRARSTWPRASPRARPAARCSSRAPVVDAGGPPPRVRAHRRGPPQGLQRADRAVPRARADADG